MSLLSRLFPRLFGEPEMWVKPTKAEVGLTAIHLPSSYGRSPRYGTDPFADAGEWIVCDGPAQHKIGMFVRDIRRGENSGTVETDVAWLQRPAPAIGIPIEKILCNECGSRWVGPGMHLHFKDGWR